MKGKLPFLVFVLAGPGLLPLNRPALAEPLADPPRRALAGPDLYDWILARARSGETAIFTSLKETDATLDWDNSEELVLNGSLRKIQTPAAGDFFLLRTVAGDVYVLARPDSAFGPFDSFLNEKHAFHTRVIRGAVAGVAFDFIRLTAPPVRSLLDQSFRLFIILLLFFVMAGMGLTLRVKDFVMIVIKPRGMLVGPLLQFGLLPALAAGLGILAGYREEYPFIFVGLVLVSSAPGGVTSNLLTYWGKGDLALSISMTAVSTVLSLVMTPLLLSLYAAGVPDVKIPTGEVMGQIALLVLVPLAIGMGVRYFFPDQAMRAEKFFSALGVFALVFLILTGILNNLDKFSDLNRYGLKFYLLIFTLSFSSMILSGVIAKFLRVENFQVRAITLEVGLQNAALAMTIALLLQDQIGDFYSSMFAVCGLYGLWMYVAAGLMIALFPKLYPVDLYFHVRDKRESRV